MDYTKALLRPYFALIINQPMLVNSTCSYQAKLQLYYTILLLFYSALDKAPAKCRRCKCFCPIVFKAPPSYY